MLSDVLVGISNHKPFHKVKKMLFFAPGTEEGEQLMKSILGELGLKVMLVPMLQGDLRAPDLGDQLQHALSKAKNVTTGNIIFLGMDSPELPLEELEMALQKQEHATLCPSSDGGYGMLCVPNNSPTEIFNNVMWSTSLTAVSQLKAISDCGISIRLGRIMNDIDDPEDMDSLISRIVESQRNKTEHLGCLEKSSSPQKNITNEIMYTRRALAKLGLI